MLSACIGGRSSAVGALCFTPRTYSYGRGEVKASCKSVCKVAGRVKILSGCAHGGGGRMRSGRNPQKDAGSVSPSVTAGTRNAMERTCGGGVYGDGRWKRPPRRECARLLRLCGMLSACIGGRSSAVGALRFTPRTYSYRRGEAKASCKSVCKVAGRVKILSGCAHGGGGCMRSVFVMFFKSFPSWQKPIIFPPAPTQIVSMSAQISKLSLSLAKLRLSLYKLSLSLCKLSLSLEISGFARGFFVRLGENAVD